MGSAATIAGISAVPVDSHRYSFAARGTHNTSVLEKHLADTQLLLIVEAMLKSASHRCPSRHSPKSSLKVHFLPEDVQGDMETSPPTCNCGNLFCFGGSHCETRGEGTLGAEYEAEPYWLREES